MVRFSAPRPRSGGRRATAIVMAVAAAAALAACGSDESGSDDGAAVTVDPPEAEQAPTDAVEEQDEAEPSETADAAGDTEAADIGSDANDVAVDATSFVEITGDPLAPLDPDADDPAIGVTAPQVTGSTYGGGEITIGAPTGRPTMIVFVAHWCPHCNDEVPELIQLETDGRYPDDLDVVAVSTAVAADRPNFPPANWLDGAGWPFPALADDDASSTMRAFGGTAFPFTVVLDGDGTVLARRAGGAGADGTIAFLDDALA